MKKTFVVFVSLICFACVQRVNAQFVRQQSMFVGPELAINLQGSQTLEFGLNFEYMMKRDVGLGGIFRYYTYVAQKYPDGGTYEYNGELIAAQANYHFKVAQNELDPFVGVLAGVILKQGGLKNTTATYVPPTGGGTDFAFAIRAGVRYFLSDKFAVSGVLAFGSHYNAIDIGVDISL